MKGIRQNRAGYTLIEVLIVVAIIGVLSSMGVVSLQGAVANARIKEAAFNVSAFMERTANESRRLNTTLCVKKVDDQKLVAYNKACGSDPAGDHIDSLILDSPVKLIVDDITGADFQDKSNWSKATVGAEFKPRPGLSAAPAAGYIAVQYGGQSLWGMAYKDSTKNFFVPRVKYSGESPWTGL
jgi:prepilin-type N-terminal cleavage/methylation domain-containing protein